MQQHLTVTDRNSYFVLQGKYQYRIRLIFLNLTDSSIIIKKTMCSDLTAEIMQFSAIFLLFFCPDLLGEHKYSQRSNLTQTISIDYFVCRSHNSLVKISFHLISHQFYFSYMPEFFSFHDYTIKYLFPVSATH